MVGESVSCKNRFLASFKYGFKKVLRLNQLAIMVVDMRTHTKEAEVTTVYAIPDYTVDLDKGYHNGVHVLIRFINRVM